MTVDDLDDWPNCKIKGCHRKSCRRLNSPYCWPHTPGDLASAGEVGECLQAEIGLEREPIHERG